MSIPSQFETWGADGAFPLNPSDEAWASDGLVWDDILGEPVPIYPVPPRFPPIKNWFIHKPWATFRRDPDMVIVAPIDYSDAIAELLAERADLISKIH